MTEPDALAQLKTALEGFDEASKNGYETTWVRDLVEASRAVLAGLEAAGVPRSQHGEETEDLTRRDKLADSNDDPPQRSTGD
jgi:hypothetical protein